MPCLVRLSQQATSLAAIAESTPCEDEFETTPPTATDIMSVVKDSITFGFEQDENEANSYGSAYGQGYSAYTNHRMVCQFDVWASGPGAAGSNGVPYNMLLGACKYAESGLGPGTAVYTKNTDLNAPATIWLEKAGWLYKMYGCRGSAIQLNEYQGFRRFRFNLQGQAGLHAPGTLPAGDFTAWNEKILITPNNVTGWDILGNAAEGRDFSVNDVNEVAVATDTGGLLIDIIDWAPTINYVAAITAAEDWRALAHTDATGAHSSVTGTVAGNILTVSCPAIQLRDWSDTDVNGYRYAQMTGRVTNESGANTDIVYTWS